MDITNAIAQSCDVYFYALAQELGIERIQQHLGEFGFGTRAGLDIGGESAGLLPSREWKRRTYGQAWFPGETLIIGIGQGAMLTTPLQLAVATATIANRGKRVRPHIFTRAYDVLTEKITFTSELEIQQQVDTRDTGDWQIVIDAMHQVVQGERGTARRYGLDAGYQFAGKTGTAQVIGIAQDAEYEEEDIAEKHRDHALFIAFAPLENPVIAIAIIVENGGSGSATAAPIARELLDHYLHAKESTQG